MPLKPQDILVGLKLCVWPDENWKFDTLPSSLGLSASETHAGVARLRQSRLLDGAGRRPLRRNFVEMLVSGVKYFYPAQQGGQVTGMPTAYAATPLREHFLELDAPAPVWPQADGDTYGFELTPLYPTVPFAAQNDAELYELLILVDALRLHQPRVTRVSGELLEARIEQLSERWHLAERELAVAS